MSVRRIVKKDALPQRALQVGPLRLEGEDFHYLVRVRRVGVGAEVELLDQDSHIAHARVSEIHGEHCVLQIEEVGALPPPPFSLRMGSSLIKGERMDWCIQKLVEIGVREIVPIESDRSVVKIHEDKRARKHQRLAKIAESAAQQSAQVHPVELGDFSSFSEFVEQSAGADLKLIPYIGRDVSVRPLREALADPSAAMAKDLSEIRSAAVAIGPEGGFSPEEAKLAVSAGFAAVSLGPRVFRAETANLVTASALLLRFGDVGS